MTNPNAPYAAQPQQSGFQPQPQFQPQQPYVPRPVAPLRTQRGLLKYVLLGLVTFSIYDIWQMSEVGDSLNLLALFWLWGILGSLIAVGPFIYIYKLLHAMNDLSADYNVRGF